MKKRNVFLTALCFIMLGGVVMFGFFGCAGKKYAVDYCGQKAFFQNAKNTYRAGNAVKLYYDHVAADTVYYFYLDGEKIQPTYDEKTGFCIHFEMPPHDVKLTIESRNISVEEDITSFKDEEVLSFHSFDGGGPDYTVTIDDPAVASYTSERRYAKKNHEMLDGAGYDKIFTFKGLKAGKTKMTVSSFSPIEGNEETEYLITVNEALRISVQQQSADE